ncbi:MAG: zinc ribbon domain-containing protein [Dehalococcoidales bacterium]|nr:zinc ribbon domain-containing protein [Dehalococcoidales bacterium]
MPIFEYKCQDCGKTSEFLIHNTDRDNNFVCSFCKSANLVRLFSIPSLQKFGTPEPGKTCCGQDERCDSAPCSPGGSCCRS